MLQRRQLDSAIDGSKRGLSVHPVSLQRSPLSSYRRVMDGTPTPTARLLLESDDDGAVDTLVRSSVATLHQLAVSCGAGAALSDAANLRRRRQASNDSVAGGAVTRASTSTTTLSIPLLTGLRPLLAWRTLVCCCSLLSALAEESRSGSDALLCRASDDDDGACRGDIVFFRRSAPDDGNAVRFSRGAFVDVVTTVLECLSLDWASAAAGCASQKAVEVVVAAIAPLTIVVSTVGPDAAFLVMESTVLCVCQWVEDECVIDVDDDVAFAMTHLFEVAHVACVALDKVVTLAVRCIELPLAGTVWCVNVWMYECMCVPLNVDVCVWVFVTVAVCLK